MKILVFLLIAFNSFATTQYSGLLIKFAPHTPNTNKDRIHKEQKATLEYRSNASRRDMISIGKNTHYAELKKKCELYQNIKAVETCFPQEIPDKPDCIDCHVVDGSVASTALEIVTNVADEISCQPYPRLYQSDPNDITSDIFGKQSRFWAQEAIGTPETIEFINTQKESPPTEIGILDGGFTAQALQTCHLSEELKSCLEKNSPTLCGLEMAPLKKDEFHGSAVAHLINGEIPPANSTRTQISRVAAAGVNSGLEAFDHMLGLGPESPEGSTGNPEVIPPIVSISMSFGQCYDDDVDRLAKETIMVVAASNDFPDPLDSGITSATPKIIVGSTAPDGSVSNFSQAGEEVTICAPSDYNLQSIGEDGVTPTDFSGTSGATPLVTAALSNVMSFLPGLTTEEAKLILQNCAIPTGSTPNGPPSQDGAGSLNSYKMIRVAARLRDQWPANRQNLEDTGLYNFSDQAKEFEDRAKEILNNDPNCEQKKEALSLLRKSFFLMPGQTSNRNLLAQVYRENGFNAQAKFYAPAAVTKNDPEIAEGNKLRAALIIAANITPENFAGQFQKLQEIGLTSLPMAQRNGEPIYWAQTLTTNLITANQDHKQKIAQIMNFLMDKDYPFPKEEFVGMVNRIPQSPTTWALLNNNTQLINHLKRHGNDIDITEELIRAIHFKEQDIIDRIFEYDLQFDINMTVEGYDQTVFGTAVLDNDHRMVEKLLSLNPNLDEPIYFGIAPDGYQYELDEPIPLREWIEQQGRQFRRVKRLIQRADH